ncbi:hypothetical protein B0H10DRAFT_2017874 [Mycena sp. CBHHK59/15]|nr:hypothetical protein B0H10DRAFT_2017874 [Mycena sp. CBHHK59/15]
MHRRIRCSKSRTPCCLLPFLFICYMFLLIPELPAEAQDQLRKPDVDYTDFDYSNMVLKLKTFPSIERSSLTAVLPVSSTSLSTLHIALLPFLGPPTCVSKVLIVCPEPILLKTRTTIRQAISSAVEDSNHPDVSLHPWGGYGDPSAAVLRAASQASTDWVLILDENGLKGLSARTCERLLCPVVAEFPVGPRGVVGSPGNHSCAFPSSEPLPASYLLPPFVLPRSFVQGPYEDWSDLGGAISRSREDQLGGIVWGFGDSDPNWYSEAANVVSTGWKEFDPDPRLTNSGLGGLFAFLLSNIDEMRLVVPLLCRLYEAGHSIKILLYSDPRPGSTLQGTASQSCNLTFHTFSDKETRPHVYPLIYGWLARLEREPDVIFTVRDPATQPITREDATFIRISSKDLRYTHWMGSLSLKEWKNWNVLQIDFSIITHDRPLSLERLLSSLSRGIFFGDSISLRLNLEQSSDVETIQMVEAFQWEHGSVFKHRRVIHGGLLPAVVESWYPHSNDSYGLLLEDDVELSPLFYAWIKMTILRYRYGEASDRSAQLFGISLYQQKNIELHPEGRKAFDPRRLFANSNTTHPSTPYLSQIPCSWGAVYFPEHWREFHDYLATRLSETRMEIDQIVVPDVRSNNWTKSWKKYFIEMVGSHVKERSKEKQEVFRLPLMELTESGQLLDLPGERLPRLDALPVLNLTGCLSSLEDVVTVGREREEELQ